MSNPWLVSVSESSTFYPSIGQHQQQFWMQQTPEIHLFMFFCKHPYCHNALKDVKWNALSIGVGQILLGKNWYTWAFAILALIFWKFWKNINLFWPHKNEDNKFLISYIIRLQKLVGESQFLFKSIAYKFLTYNL